MGKLATWVFVTVTGFLFSNIASASKNVFKIQPYLYFQNDSSINLSWQYKNKKDLESFKLPLDKSCDFKDVFYQIKGMTVPQSLKNIPCSKSGENIKISFIADTQEGTETDQKFSQMIEAFDSHSVILGGDLIQNADDEGEWEDLFKAISETALHRVLVPVIGNHEYRGDKEAQNWQKYFGFNANQAYYSVWLGPVKVIVLSSNFEDDSTMILKQLTWLDKELSQEAPWKFVVFHHPPYSKSIMHAPYYWRKEYLSLRQYYVPLFEKHKVDVVLNGHSHIYEHSLKENIHYITTGAAGGKPGKEGAQNPFEILSAFERTIIQFEVNQKALRMTAINLDGKTIDDLFLNK